MAEMNQDTTFIHMRESGSRASHTPMPARAGLTSGLESDILQDASRRLRVVALVSAGLWLFYYVFYQTIGRTIHERPPNFQEPMYHVQCIAGFVLSIGLLLLARSERLRPERLLDVGLLFEVLTGGLIASLQANLLVRAGVESIHMMGISWLCIWILFYPTVVHSTRRKIFAAALATAAMDPILFYAVCVVRGVDPPGPIFILNWSDNFVCALLAMVPAHVVHHLSRKVKKAREMGSYRLVELIGKGGMGEVWKARHRMLARPAAVKLIRPEALGGGNPDETRLTLLRFEREAQATAALQSPHSIELFDFGLSRDGTFYSVMELLDGFDLESLVKRFGPIPAARAIALLVQACHSLQDAHATGLVHRDVKPANIFVCRKGLDHDYVKVLDFGLVKAQRPGPIADSRMATRVGTATGTPAFMAPEQAMGEDAIDHRIDIYALGCVAYWLVTGQLVFESANAMQMLVMHAKDDPVPPSQRAELDVPAAFDRLILECLAKEPGARPQSARELAERLRAIETRDPWSEERAQEWWRLHAPQGGARDGAGARDARDPQAATL